LKSRPDSTSRGVAVGEVPNRFRKFGRVRHRGAVEQHREDDEIAPQRGLQLDPHRIGCIRDPRFAVGLRPEPIMPDNGDQQIAGLQRIVDMLAEIDAERDIVDIDEQARLAEMLRQPVEDAPGHGGIGAPVGDDDLRILPVRGHVFPGPQQPTAKDRSVLLKERDGCRAAT
jgi:hypothetical protein